MVNIKICICTRRRQDGLKRLLGSIDKLVVPDGTNVSLVIVENDEQNMSEYVINDYLKDGRFQISYHLEMNPGIVNARNRSVLEAGDCDFCCFTDDDEVVSQEWLAELLRCQKEFDSAAVAGPTFPVFSSKVPIYISDFHQPKTYPYGTIVESAFTGCLLIRKHFLDFLDGPFDSRVNFSGGEDALMTMRLSAAGGIIRFNPGAVAYEFVPESRTTIAFAIKRKFRTANTELLIKSLTRKSLNKSAEIFVLIKRFCFGLLLVIPCFIFGKSGKLNGLLKIVNAVGGFAFFFGRKSMFYKSQSV